MGNPIRFDDLELKAEVKNVGTGSVDFSDLEPKAPVKSEKPLGTLPVPTAKPIAALPPVETSSTEPGVYFKNGIPVIDTKRKDSIGRVPTHRVDQPTGKLPNESWTQYEERVLNKTDFGDTMKHNDINLLESDVKSNVELFVNKAKLAGINLGIAETRRSQDRQEMLFQIGRKKGDKNKPVTWTLTSDHANGRAVDFTVSGDKEKAYKWIQENAPKSGFTVLGSIDPAHVSMPDVSGRVASDALRVDPKLPTQIPTTKAFAPADASVVNKRAEFILSKKLSEPLSMDDFIGVNDKLDRGTFIKLTEPTGNALRKPGEGIGALHGAATEAFTFGADVVKDPIEAVRGLIGFVPHVLYNKFRASMSELGTTPYAGVIDKKIADVFGGLNQDQIEDANRMFNAVAVSVPAGIAGGLIAGPVGAELAGGAAFGAVSAPEGEKSSSAIANAVMGVALGQLHKVAEIGGMKGTADDIHNLKQVRAFDEQAPQATESKLTDKFEIVEVPKTPPVESKIKVEKVVDIDVSPRKDNSRKALHFSVYLPDQEMPIDIMGSLENGEYKVSDIAFRDKSTTDVSTKGILGTKGAREVLRQIQQLAPDVKSMSGERVTGTRGALKDKADKYFDEHGKPLPESIVKVELPPLQKAKQIAKDFGEATSQKPLEYHNNATGNRVIVSKNVKPGEGPWRVTEIANKVDTQDEVVPIKHIDFKTYDEAVKYADNHPYYEAVKKETPQTLDQGLVSAIIKSVKTVDPKEAKIITGVDNPMEALKKAKEIVPDGVTAVFKRSDGKYDVAIGGPRSALKGSQAQFAKEGYYEGQIVAVDGKHYTYLSSGNSGESWVRLVGAEERFKVKTSDIRRLPYSPVEVGVGKGILHEASEILDADEFKLYKELIKHTVPEIVSIDDAAVSNGHKVTIGGAGDFQIRDKNTGDILHRTFVASEVHDYINKSGQTNGRNLLPDEVEYSSDALRGLGMKPPNRPENPANSPIDGLPPEKKLGGFEAHLNDLIAVRAPWAVPFANYISGVDNLFKTSLYKSVVHDLQEAKKVMDIKARPWLHDMGKEVGKLWEKVAKNTDRIHVVGQYMQQLSAQEILDGKMMKNGRKPSSNSTTAAANLSDLNTDLSRVKSYVLNKKLEIESLGEDAPREVILKSIDDLEREWKLTANEKKAAKIIDDILITDLDDTPLFEVLSLAEAYQSNAPTQAEYAKMNKMTPEELSLAHKTAAIYDKLGPEMGIEDWRMLNRYMHRMASDQISDINMVALDRFRKSGQIPNERQFAGEMIRSGLLDAYVRDPVLSLLQYTRSGHYNKFMKPAWENAREQLKTQLDAAVEDKRINAATHGEVSAVINEYLSSIRGIPDRAVQATRSIVGRFFEKKGWKIDQDITRNFVNALLANTSNALLGYRVGPAIRDAVVSTSLYDMWYGKTRAASFVKYAMNQSLRKHLLETGGISSFSAVKFFSPDDLYNSKLGKNLKGVSGFFQSWAENGLALSGQRLSYEMVATGAYGEARSVAMEGVSKLLSGEWTKEQAYDHIQLYNFPETVQRAFDDIVGKSQTPMAAADFLGKENIRMIVPIFGNGNHPRGWTTNIGKVAGQFGQYTAWSRAMLMDAASRGTKKQISRRMLRLAMSQSAAVIAANAVGVNITNWLAAPSLNFSGGPVGQAGHDIWQSMVGNDYEKEAARRRLGRLAPSFVSPARIQSGDLNSIFSDPRSILVPGSFALNDVLETAQAVSNGESIRAATRILGIPLMAPRPWWQGTSLDNPITRPLVQ